MRNYQEAGICPESVEYSLSQAANALPGSGSDYIGSLDFVYAPILDTDIKGYSAQQVFYSAIEEAENSGFAVKIVNTGDGRPTFTKPTLLEVANVRPPEYFIPEVSNDTLLQHGRSVEVRGSNTSNRRLENRISKSHGIEYVVWKAPLVDGGNIEITPLRSVRRSK